jgi:hypothetical protein
MLSWAQRTAQWTVKTLPFPLGRFGGPARETTDTEADAQPAGDEAVTVPAGTTPAGPGQASTPGDHGSRHRASHERVAAPSTRGRHAAPSRSRRTRTVDTD